MATSISQLFNIDIIILLANYLVDDNQLLNCNKYLFNLKPILKEKQQMVQYCTICCFSLSIGFKLNKYLLQFNS